MELIRRIDSRDYNQHKFIPTPVAVGVEYRQSSNNVFVHPQEVEHLNFKDVMLLLLGSGYA